MKRLVYTLFGALFILYYICYQGVLSHVLYYHEQHHLFLFSKSYFLQCVQSEGWLNYITNFIYSIFLLSYFRKVLFWHSLLASVYWLTNSIIKIITRERMICCNCPLFLPLFFFSIQWKRIILFLYCQEVCYAC